MGTVYGGRWEILNPLREGGQAHTFLVSDKKGDGEIKYVLKRLKNLNRINRFKNEIEAIRNLTHINIVRLVDFDIDASKPYLVMEYCSGGSLSEAERLWRGSPVEALRVFHQICEGVAYAHSQKIIHRDLKPENIFLRTKTGPAVVGDFGICFLEEDGTRNTLTEEAVGSRLFIAPELEDGRVKDVSSASDVYSLGKILYWLLSGGKIFSRERHREEQWDLKMKDSHSLVGWSNVYLEHANRMLDFMVISDHSRRINMKDVLSGIEKVSRLIQKEYNPINKNIKQPCTYCGYGVYRLMAVAPTEVRNFGFQSLGSAEWRIFACSECGHVQTFRIDLAERKYWWK